MQQDFMLNINQKYIQADLILKEIKKIKKLKKLKNSFSN